MGLRERLLMLLMLRRRRRRGQDRNEYFLPKIHPHQDTQLYFVRFDPPYYKTHNSQNIKTKNLQK